MEAFEAVRLDRRPEVDRFPGSLPAGRKDDKGVGLSQVPTADRRLAHLDGLRAVAALYVVLNHLYLHIWPARFGEPPIYSLRMWIDWMYYGHFAVTVFIVLSGFFLGLKALKHDYELGTSVRGFILSRAKRILPPYYAALGLSLLLILTVIGDRTGTHWDRSLPVTEDALIVRMALLQDFFPSGQINHVLWSVALEWHIYFFFPLLLLLWRKANPWLATLLFLVIGYGVDRIAGESMLDIVSPHFLGLFAVGALGAGIAYGPQLSWDKARTKLPWTALAMLFGGLAFALILYRGRNVFVDRADMLVGLSAVSLLISLSLSDGTKVHRALRWRPLLTLGGYSYSLYLIHAPLIQVVWKYVVHPFRLKGAAEFVALVAVGMPLILLTSYAFYWVAERPTFSRRALGTQKSLDISQAS